MNAQFKKGQLVAVCDDECSKWHLWIYDHASPEGMHFCRSPNRMIAPHWWKHAVPAEEIWPGVFLGWERKAGEQAADAVAMESELVQRLRRQIAWLCRQIVTNALHRKQSDFCPPLDMPTDPDGRCQRSCIACWEQASLKAVEKQQ